ncbi:MAG: hypothetical protein CO149_01965 [Nitrospirae bacterium CG_4_9_14_3_um_filter_51_5]|nr:MAG: hypothetical protein CO149_01965 [Nitrospirae bacterium CG_4_9_14_3_um_filter_51_5]
MTNPADPAFYGKFVGDRQRQVLCGLCHAGNHDLGIPVEQKPSAFPFPRFLLQFILRLTFEEVTAGP